MRAAVRAMSNASINRMFVLAAVLAVTLAEPVFAHQMTDAEIRQAIIAQSLAGYPGPCPCPYNVMRNGRSCGSRSAYSRPGGYSPICYAQDVTSEMIGRYRRAHPSP